MLEKYKGPQRVKIYNFILDICYKILPASKKTIAIRLENVLLCNGAHLGDVLLSLRLASEIKRQNPSCKIGMICGSWTKSLVEACKDVDMVYINDNWHLNRSSKSILSKLYQYYRTRANTLKKLKKAKYDVAIDLFNRYPSSSFLFWQAGIPCRVGYGTGGGGPLLTTEVEWGGEHKHVIEYQADLLRAVGFNIFNVSNTCANFKYERILNHTLSKFGVIQGEYVVVCPCSGEPKREWSVERWQKVISYLDKIDIKVVITGAGKREQDVVDTILAYRYSLNVVSLCNQLNLSEFMQLIRGAKFMIGCESFAGHVAAMWKIPQISIMHGATPIWEWRPYANPHCKVIRASLPCIGCGAPRRCPRQNECMNITVEKVLYAINKIDKI